MQESLLSLLAALAATPVAHAQFLLCPESTNDKVILLDAFNGSVLNAAYIDLVPAGAVLPIEALVVGSEIWVSDQTADRIMRFSLDGTTWLGNIIGGLDNIRGMEVVGSEVWVANSGSANSAPPNSIIRYTTAGAFIASFPSNSPWDIVNYQGDVLVSDNGTSDIRRYDTAGMLLSTPVTTGISFPEQIWPRANGNFYVAGFISPAGIYQYDPTGAQLNYYAISSGPRGVAELGNGLILFADSAIRTYDPNTMTTTPILTGVTARMFAPFAGANVNPPPVPYCFGDGSGTACPCTPVPLVGDADKGCPNSFNAGGGKLTASGNASISADTLVMTCTTINNGGAVIFQGTNDNGGGLGTAFGDGLRCAAGTVRRMRSHPVTTNSHQYPDPAFLDNSISIRGAVLAPGDRWYQGWYRSGLAHCDPTQNYNLTNGVKITWVP